MNVSDISKKMISLIIIIGLLSIFASVIYYRSLDFLPFLLGVVLGSLVSITKVYLLRRAVDKTMTMDKAKAGNYVSLQHLLRLLLSGAALLLAALVPQINLWGTIIGILAFQLSLYVTNLTGKTKAKSQKNT